MNITIIRHAEKNFNDGNLTLHGEESAKALLENFKDIKNVLSSPLGRVKQTIELVSGKEVKECDYLNPYTNLNDDQKTIYEKYQRGLKNKGLSEKELQDKSVQDFLDNKIDVKKRVIVGGLLGKLAKIIGIYERQHKYKHKFKLPQTKNFFKNTLIGTHQGVTEALILFLIESSGKEIPEGFNQAFEYLEKAILTFSLDSNEEAQLTIFNKGKHIRFSHSEIKNAVIYHDRKESII